MTGWDREYLANKEEYLKIFDGAMQQEQEQNVEFLEKSLTKITGRKYAAVSYTHLTLPTILRV